MTNLSQWFDLAEQKPWQPGIYQVCWMPDHMFNWYAFWDGEDFRAIYDEIHLADKCRDEKRIEVVRKWRGLSTNPEAKNKPRNQRKQFVIVMEAAGENLERQHPVGVFEDEKNADAFLEIHQKRCPKFYYYKSWTPRFRTPE